MTPWICFFLPKIGEAKVMFDDCYLKWMAYMINDR